MRNFTIATLFTALLLTGCISREQADEKLAKACAAGVEVFLEEGFRIKEIKNKTFGDYKQFGEGYREIRITVLESDDWLEIDKDYKCIFAENIGPFGLSYDADIYQLKFNDETYGKDGDEILGTLNDITKLGNAVNDALGK